MNDGDDLDWKFAGKAAVLLWIAGPVVYVALLVRYPDYWAIATAIVFVILSGLFTTKIVLSLESPRAMFGLLKSVAMEPRCPADCRAASAEMSIKSRKSTPGIDRVRHSLTCGLAAAREELTIA
jgi:hypothetical protein